MRLSEKSLDKLRTYFESRPFKKVYLFGSFARGEGQRNSDIDLLVTLDYDAIANILDVFIYPEELAQLMKRKVDFVTKPSRYIIDEIENDKVLIYEKSITPLIEQLKSS